jgi:hypothetical protein
MLFQGEHWFLGGILGCLPSPLPLLRVETTLSAVGTELGGVQPSGFEHHRGLLGGNPTIGVLLRCRHNLSLQPTGLPPVVERDHVDSQLC